MSPRAVFVTLATLAAAVLAALGSFRSGELYQQLDKPSWAPPPSAFSPVWAALYVLMGLAALLVIRRAGRRTTRGALSLFTAQLALNALWPWLFFRWRLGGVALAEILALLVVLSLTVPVFARIHRTAAALLLPYLLWVAYAAALTWSVWRRNPALLAVTGALHLTST